METGEKPTTPLTLRRHPWESERKQFWSHKQNELWYSDMQNRLTGKKKTIIVRKTLSR